MKIAAAALALISLAACLVTAVLFFSGALARPAFEGAFLAASVGWFVGASLWASRATGTTEEVLS